MQDTYLNQEATLARMRRMETQADTIRSVLEETHNIMDDLSKNFEGISANKLQASYQEVAETFVTLRQYFQSKIKDMETLTSNIANTDER